MAISNTDLERAYYLAVLGITEAQAAGMSFAQLLQSFNTLGTSGNSIFETQVHAAATYQTRIYGVGETLPGTIPVGTLRLV